MRRSLLQGAAATVLLAAGLGQARAQRGSTVPEGAVIRMIIPFAAGGPIDLIARMMSEKLGAELGGVVVIDNRPSGNGAVAGQAVANGPRDGTMLLFTAGSNLTITPNLDASLPYDPRKAFAPISRVVINGSALAVTGTIPAKDVKELVAWAKQRGGPLKLASNGVGGISHIWLELFRRATGIDVLHVPYRGAGPALNDVIGGKVDGLIADLFIELPHVEAGRLKLMGLVGQQRHPAAPQLPTIAEQGFPGVDGLNWSGILAPAGTPPALLQKQAAAIAKVLADPVFAARLRDFGAAPAPTSPEELTAIMARDTAWWGTVIKENKITLE